MAATRRCTDKALLFMTGLCSGVLLCIIVYVNDTPWLVPHMSQRYMDYPPMISSIPFIELPTNFSCQKWIVTTVGGHDKIHDKIHDTFHGTIQASRFMTLRNTSWCAVLMLGDDDRVIKPFNTSNIRYRRPYRLFVFSHDRESGKINRFNVTDNALPTFTPGIGLKTIGYLFAISKGATMIFDDVLLAGEEGQTWSAPDPPFIKENADLPLVIPAGRVHFWNPLSYFYSRKDVWPRGFPRDMAGRAACHAPPVTNALRSTRVLLTHYLMEDYADISSMVPGKVLSSPLTLKKTDISAVAVQHGTFVPCNHHSTLHLYDVFWGLFIPKTRETIIADIIRSYITQRLLWDINGTIALSPLNATPNSHISGPKTASDSTGDTVVKMINCLKSWTSKSKTIQLRLEELYQHLFDNGLVLKDDVDAVKAWLRHLVTIGYRFPRVEEQSWSEREKMPKPWDGVQLCVHFNHAPIEPAITTLYQMYSRHFKQITFTGEGDRQPYMDESVPFLPCNEQNGGYYLFRCILKHAEYGGFGNENRSLLFVSDDTFFNLSSFMSYRRDVMWILGPIETYDINLTWPDGWMWWPKPYGGAALRRALDTMPSAWRENMAIVKNWNKTQKRLVTRFNSDSIYIPNNRFQVRFFEVLRWLKDVDLFTEIAVPLIVDITSEKPDRSDVISLENSNPWSGRDLVFKTRSCNLMHPLKMSKKDDKEFWLSMFRSVEELLQRTFKGFMT